MPKTFIITGLTLTTLAIVFSGCTPNMTAQPNTSPVASSSAAVAVSAMPAATALPDKPTAEGVRYAANLKTSVVQWSAEKILGTPHHTGKIALHKAIIDVQPPADDTGTTMPTLQAAEFVLDMASITDEDLSDTKMNTMLVTHLKSADFFDVEKYPISRLIITKAEPSGKDQYMLTGTLTIRDVTQPITFPATVVVAADGSATAQADITIDRTKYGIKFGSGQFFKEMGDKAIKDEFMLNVSLKLMKAS
jgi:polyisoprenoid-binding protein YceI